MLGGVGRKGGIELANGARAYGLFGRVKLMHRLGAYGSFMVTAGYICVSLRIWAKELDLTALNPNEA